MSDELNIDALKARIAELEDEVGYLRATYAPSDRERYDIGYERTIYYSKANPPQDGFQDEHEHMSIAVHVMGNYGTPFDTMVDALVTSIIADGTWGVEYPSEEIPGDIRETLAQRLAMASAAKLLAD